MQYKAKELREERANIVAQINDLVQLAKDEERSFSADEVAKFDDLDAKQSQLLEEAESYERMERAEALTTKSTASEYRANPKRDGLGTVSYRDQHDALKAFFLKPTGETPQQYKDAAEKCGLDLSVDSFRFNLKDGISRYGSTNTPQSHLVSGRGVEFVKEEMANSIEVALKEYGGMRDAASVIRTATGGTLPIPGSDDTMESGVRVSENTEITTKSILSSEKQLSAYKYTSKLVKVPVELMQDSAFNIAQFVGETLGTRIGRITNYEFTRLSSTAGGPVGALSAVGGTVTMSTASATHTASKLAITYQELLDLVHSVDHAYRKRASFMFGDTFLKFCKQLVDSQNRPLWVPGVASGEPDTIGGYRYHINYDFPDPDAGAKACAFGDWSQYVIRDVQEVQISRLSERWAEYGQVAFVALSRHDGKFKNPSTVAPVKHLTFGSSTA